MLKIEDVVKTPVMPEEKILAMLEEFPFIQECVKGEHPLRVFVSRVKPELLSLKCEEKRQSCGHIIHIDKVFYIDRMGSPIPHEVEHEEREQTFFGHRYIKKVHSDLERWHKYAIGTAVKEIERKGADVVYILWVRYFRGKREEDTGNTVIVYKPPKGLSVCEWVRQQINAEREKILQECKVIDDEAAS